MCMMIVRGDSGHGLDGGGDGGDGGDDERWRLSPKCESS